jgi:hypothetical protein
MLVTLATTVAAHRWTKCLELEPAQHVPHIFVGPPPLDLLHWPQATPSQALRRRARHESSAAPAPRTFRTHLPQPRLALLAEPRHHVEPVLGRPPALRVPPPATRDFHLIHLLPSGVTPYVVPRLSPILGREAPPPARGLNRNRGPPTTHDASTSDCPEPQRGAPRRASHESSGVKQGHPIWSSRRRIRFDQVVTSQSG